MAARVGELRQPAPREARLVALRLLDDASEARGRLTNEGDEDALHDFRVAVRRLRSWTRAFTRELSDSVSKKRRRRLRKIAHGTNASRDLQVHLEWLRGVRDELGTRDQHGADWLIARFEADQRKQDARVRRRVAADFDDLRAKLKGRLAVYRRTVDVREPARETPLGAAAATLAHEMSGDLCAHLEQVHGTTDAREAHQARIAGKRLRYLLEPFGDLVPEADDVVRELKAMQDALGALHDAHVFMDEIGGMLEEAAVEQARRVAGTLGIGASDGAALRRARRRDPTPGLITLVHRLQERAARCYHEVERGWLGDRLEPFRARVERAARALEEGSGGDVEIERKYLLRALPPRARDVSAQEIAQGYIPGERLAERLRSVKTPSGERFYRTVKLGDGVSRMEIEEETSGEIFRPMWRLTEGHRLAKRRYDVEDGDRVWEIDTFLDRDLVLAEIELPTVDTAVEIPDWLAPYVEREVTGEQNYANINLAQ